MLNVELPNIICVIVLFLSLFPSVSSSFSSPQTIVFSTIIRDEPCNIQLSFQVEIDGRIPTKLPPTQSRDITIKCLPKIGTSALQHELFAPKETAFVTPIGDLHTYLGECIGEINYYMKVSNASVLVRINVKGNGTVSPSSLLLDSSKTRVVSVSHVGSMSSRENITIQMSFQYLGSLAIVKTGQYGIKIGETTEEISVEGDSVLSGIIEVAPTEGWQLDLSSAILVCSGILIVFLSYIVYSKRKKKKHAVLASK